MSHFCVLVIAHDEEEVENLLAPYDEEISVEPYINRTKAEIIEDAKRIKKNIEERIKEDPDYKVNDWNMKYLNSRTDEQFYNANIYEDCEYDEDGNELTTYNPKSKWDWYSFGGRWSGYLKTKSGDQVDICGLDELDLMPDKEKYERAIRFWEVVVDGDELKPGENKDDFFNLYKIEYYTNRYKDKFHYAKNCASFATFAVVTNDGEWHEKGEMGWFGESSDTGEDEDNWIENFSSLIKKEDQSLYAFMVDCHI